MPKQVGTGSYCSSSAGVRDVEKRGTRGTGHAWHAFCPLFSTSLVLALFEQFQLGLQTF